MLKTIQKDGYEDMTIFTSNVMFLIVIASVFFQNAFAQTSTIYYVRPTNPDGLQLARINADGSTDALVNTGLPVTSFPGWSKDGRVVFMTSTDPQRPSKISQNVVAYDPASGAAPRIIVPFEDRTSVEPVFVGNVKVGEQNRFSYVVPLFKALSPDKSRIAVSSIVTSGFYQAHQEPFLKTLTGVTQTPQVEIFNAADGMPLELVVLGRVRSYVTLGGFGLDWHPTENFFVTSIDVDSPTIGLNQPSESSALFLIEAIPNAIDTGHARQLTHPTGFYQPTQFGTIKTIQTDYAPAFSPDGQSVAYFRAEITDDGSTGFVVRRPVSVGLRMVGLDGSNDRPVLQLNAGLFSTQLSWSPDGRQIAFDLGQQSTNKTLEAIPNTLEIGIVNIDGSNPHPLRAPAAAMPAWQPASLAPSLTVRMDPANRSKLLITWPVSNQPVSIESALTLGPGAIWKVVTPATTTQNNQNTATIDLATPAAYFRLRLL